MPGYFETAAHSLHTCDRVYLSHNEVVTITSYMPKQLQLILFDTWVVYLTKPNRTHGVSAMFCIHSDRHPEINLNIEGLRALQEWV